MRAPRWTSARVRYGVPAVTLVLVAVAAVLVAANTSPMRVADLRGDARELPRGEPAGPLDGATGWLNSAPLQAADLAGKVVVYDFWTYSCVNCVRTLPHLRAWHERYAADGLLLLGVHSPEFAFEHMRANVEAATRRLDVTWPVVLDNDRAIWDTFNNNYWPTKYVADREGRIRYKHIGEGGYLETEDVLRGLLGVDPASPHAGAGEPDASVPVDGVTSETYLGTDRGRTGAGPGLRTYPEPGPVAAGDCRLVGRWLAEEEKVTAGAPDAAIVLRYRASEVNLVMAVPANSPVEVKVELDGRPLEPALRTEDTAVDGDGTTSVRVDAPRLYRIVAGPAVEEHTLRLVARQPEVAAYAFTFGP